TGYLYLIALRQVKILFNFRFKINKTKSYEIFNGRMAQTNYGNQFNFMNETPDSVFLAEGSEIFVMKGASVLVP
ncbi:MAG: Unknown protein, partial [uncultured Aureispira sp.]